MIRLQRVGRKHDPSFRIVLTDSKNGPQSGKFLDMLGSYDARKGAAVIDGDRIRQWIGKGAKASATMHNLLVRHKVIKSSKIKVAKKKKVA